MRYFQLIDLDSNESVYIESETLPDVDEKTRLFERQEDGTYIEILS